MIDPKAALLSSIRYLRHHPDEVFRQLRNSTRLKFGVPVEALQWLANELESASGHGPKDVRISPCPPGLRIVATVEQMGTVVRANCVLVVKRVTIDETQARVELRLSDVELRLLDESTQTPLAALIRSGTLDLTRMASLVAYLPSRPAALVEAADDRLVLDLLKLPNWDHNERVRRVIGILSSILTIESIDADAGHLDVGMRAFPRGISGVLR